MAPGFTLPKPTVFLFQPTLALCLLLYSASPPQIVFTYRDANFHISVFILLFRIGVNLEIGIPTCGNSQFCGFLSSSSSSFSSPVLEQREASLCSGGDLLVGLGWYPPGGSVLYCGFYGAPEICWCADRDSAFCLFVFVVLLLNCLFV